MGGVLLAKEAPGNRGKNDRIAQALCLCHRQSVRDPRHTEDHSSCCAAWMPKAANQGLSSPMLVLCLLASISLGWINMLSLMVKPTELREL